ncbi:EAL domain-containing protein [Sulfurimonas sp.]|uniref:EAL domain-containing protein n=1 Tax=Sulfurimonas sp. TaxID=2022749 RepID=UPI003563F877
MSGMKLNFEKYIFDNAKVGIAICNAEDHRLEMVNPAFAAIHGYEVDELIGVMPGKVFAPECMFRLSEQGKNPQCALENIAFETTHVKKDGSFVDVSVHITVIKDKNGKVLQRIANIVDISKRKKVEKELESSNDRYAQIFNNSNDNIYLIEVTPDKRFIHIEINEAYEKSCGIKREDIVGIYVDELANKDVRKEFLKKFNKCLEKGEKIEYTSEFNFPIGNKIFHSSLSPIKDKYGRVYQIVGVSRDITKSKQMEEELLSREEMFRTLAENSPNIIIRYDEEGNRIYTNPAFSKYTGIPKKIAVSKKPETELSAYFSLLNIDISQYYERVKKVIQSGEKDIIPLEWMIIDTCEYISYDINIVAERDKSGNIIGALAIGHNVTERKNIERRIEYMAHHDALTGLPNRVLVKDRAYQALNNAEYNDSKVAILFIDLDGFKTVNDSLGHTAGDDILKMLSSRLKSVIRANDVLSRQGGDEFLLIIPDVHNINEVSAFAERILKECKKNFSINNHYISMSASIGISIYPDHGNNFEQLLQCSDAAMYKAKEEGKNNYCFFSQRMKHDLIGLFQMQNDLKKAIKNKEFVLHYQPQINLADNRIVGVEALLRWEHPKQGIISPMCFIPVAESSGLIVEIGEWVLLEACKQAVLWNNDGKNISVAVNVSAVQFKRGNLEKVVKTVLAETGLNPKYLELELTESILINDTETVLEAVKAIKELGIQLSIDDFGTGYSSLSYLKRFAVDKLKIDQSFVKDILNDKDDAKIVQTIIQMAKNFNLKTIAEGVEDKDVLKVINEFGCDEVQGYHFAKPMCKDEFNDYCESCSQ